jgi:nitrite reductase/ring-hydroxylating ferredoxin subunit
VVAADDARRDSHTEIFAEAAMTGDEKNSFRVCALADLADPGSRSFVIEQGEWPMHGFVVRQDGRVYGYLNVCPHAGRTLNWGPDRFLTKDLSLIMCSAHGALFEISTGLCVAGPCQGDALSSIETRVEDDHVVVYPAWSGR